MDPKEIRELIELISRSDFSEFELEGKGFKLKLVRQRSSGGAVVAVESNGRGEAAGAAIAPAGPAAAEAVAGAAPAEGVAELRAPIVGTFYRSPTPDAPPFVEVGAKVKKGQVMCIVEAMKVMNEIESEIDAEVLEVLCRNGQPVEYGEPMFRLRPSG